jgi:hypothetical protein
MTLCAKPLGGRAYASRRRRVLIVDDHVRVSARAHLLIEGVQRNPEITIARSDDSVGRNPLSIASDSPLGHSFETDVQPDDEFPETAQIRPKEKTAVDDDDCVFRNFNGWKIDRSIGKAVVQAEPAAAVAAHIQRNAT